MIKGIISSSITRSVITIFPLPLMEKNVDLARYYKTRKLNKLLPKMSVLIFLGITVITGSTYAYDYNDDYDYNYNYDPGYDAYGRKYFGPQRKPRTYKDSGNSAQRERDRYEDNKLSKRKREGQKLAQDLAPAAGTLGQLFQQPKSEPTAQELCTKSRGEGYRGRNTAEKISTCIAQNLSKVSSKVQRN